MRVSKLATIFIAMLLCVFMASTAMAIDVTNRSAEMDDFSPCDRAGTIQMTLTQTDWNIITDYLDPTAVPLQQFVRIRIALNGLSLPPSPTLPNLCGAIHGTVSGVGAGANGGNLPYLNLVDIQTMDVEVSDVGGTAGVRDITAYVHGDVGDQFIELFITDLDGPDTGFNFDSAPPWFKIGLYTDLRAVGDFETTQICAQVLSFSGVSTLTISNDALPNTIAFSGDNEIGHFLAQQVSLNDCTKTDMLTDGCAETEVIDNCPLGGTLQSPACPTYRKCFVMEGDLPTTGDMRLNIRTNGAATGDNTQEGIYFKNITLTSETGVAIPGVVWTPLTADGNPAVLPCAVWEAEWVTAIVPSVVTSAIATQGNEIRFCVEYTANPDEIAVNTDVLFWVTAEELPCGSIVNGTVTGASIIECSPGAFTMYFPYVLTASAPWSTGIVVTNIGTVTVPADMEATFTLTDSTGAIFTYVKSDFTTTIYAFFLDDMVAEFGAPAAGPAWLQVDTNFPVDGYEFLTDGIFGAGTLPRL